jgi:CheY-like chemotaxis protein
MATVLIVDDSELQIEFERALLEDENLSVQVARSGEQCLVLARRLRPDLILMDIVMPGMDGIETLQALRRYEETRDIPIIMVTSQTELDYMEGAFVGGCNDYITKPVVRSELLAKISSLTGLPVSGYRT